jgi:hypothetical protein
MGGFTIFFSIVYFMFNGKNFIQMAKIPNIPKKE